MRQRKHRSGGNSSLIPLPTTELDEEHANISTRSAGDRQFVSVDLETYSDERSRTKIMLFGFSTGEHITGPDLSATEILPFIEKMCRVHGKTRPIYVGFGFRYEISHFLRDMPFHTAERLWRGKGRNSAVHWRGLRWEYLKGKYFQITGEGISFRVYECLSWFNSSLVNAANKHLRDDDVWAEYKSLITSEKNRRGEFMYSDLKLVTEYWRAEQLVFVRLMERLRALIVAAELPLPTHWWGPSALTAACFRKYGVKEHMPNELPEDFVMACRFAYYGGRFEQFKAGAHYGTVWQYDITSAYPHAMRFLWSWSDSRLSYLQSARERPFTKFGLYHLRYRSNGDTHWRLHAPHPFPYRNERGLIFFPPYVEGWYWGPEVEPYWNDPSVEIFDAWIIEPGTERPFRWVEELFAIRCNYKRNGNPAEYVVKIAINSAYGKTAQRVGWNEEKKLPPEFHNLAWAGFITSNCRAMVWHALRLARGGVFQIETDAVFSTKPINLPLISGEFLSSDLGLWERTEYESFVGIQNGIYWAKQNGAWKPPKFRGIRQGSRGITVRDAERYLAKLSAEGRSAQPLVAETTAFYGQGHRATFRHMRWLPEKKETQFAGEGKRYWFGNGMPDKEQVILTNGIARPSKTLGYHDITGHTYPHHLPWAISQIAKEIEELERDQPDYAD